ncbi:hypothetical protein TruAng_007185 [Truncatella angustata]|nr:hypothetical protein TruAng_007185 [Truncatella angustata]
MHLLSHNAEHKLDVLHQFIRANLLGVVTTAIRCPPFPLLQASHIPWVIDIVEEDVGSLYGRLRGHMARQNPQAKSIIEYVSQFGSDSNEIWLPEDVLVMFNGLMYHYITPKFHKETKPNTGKVVPTWDYDAVQVYGKARVYIDMQSDVFDT